MDGMGNATAVWIQYDGLQRSAFSRRFESTTGWQNVVLMETNDTNAAFSPRISVNRSGDAMSIWRQSDGTTLGVYSRRYAPATGWGAVELAAAITGSSVTRAEIAINGRGNSFLVYEHTAYPLPSHIVARQHLATSSWQPQLALEIETTYSAESPKIVIDDNDNAIAIWHQADGVRNNIWINRFVANSGWSGATLLDTSDINAQSPAITMDREGNAIAAWQHIGATFGNVWAARFDITTGWDTPVSIENNPQWSSDIQLAADGNGNIFTVWEYFDGSLSHVWGNRYIKESGWSTAQELETDSIYEARLPQIAADDSGRATLVWINYSDLYDNAVARRFE